MDHGAGVGGVAGDSWVDNGGHQRSGVGQNGAWTRRWGGRGKSQEGEEDNLERNKTQSVRLSKVFFFFAVNT